MADIKCPMCGKANPAEAEVCKYCQARLKPLTSSNKGSGAVPAPGSGGDETDWLRNLAAGAPPAPAGPADSAPEPEPEAEEPDWLSRIRQKSKEEEDAVSPIGRPPKIEPGAPTDPLSAAIDVPTKPAGPLTPPAPFDDGDWLQSLRTAHLGAEPPAPPIEASALGTPPLASTSSPALEDLDNDQWLASLNARLGSAPGYTPPAQPAAGERLPFKPLSSQGDLIGKSQSPADDLPDWLNSFDSAAGSAAESAPSEDAAAHAEIPDWLKGFAGEPPAAAAAVPPAVSMSAPEPPPAARDDASSDLTDWLKSFSAGQTTPADSGQPPFAGLTVPAQPAAPQAEAPIETPAEPEAAAAEMPDWLKAFAAEQPAVPMAPAQPAAPQAEAPIEAPAEPEAAAAGMPDWLKAFAAEQPAVPETAPAQLAPTLQAAAPIENPQEPEAAAAEMPDWLKSFASEQPAAPATAPAQPAAPPSATLPQAAAPIETSAEPEAVPSDVPDWLKDFAAPPAASQGTPSSEKSEPHDSGALLGGINRHTGELILPASMAKNEEIPDWLKSYSQRETEPSPTEPAQEPEPEQPSHVSPFSESNLPDWMYGEQGATPAAAESRSSFELPPGEPLGVESSGPARPFAGQEVSQWLDASASEQAASDEAAKSHPGDLEMAPLPAWLQAMRPVESAAPPTTDNVDDQRIEKSGPLAGLRGILRGEDLVTQYQKPPAYSVKLRVTEPQSSRAGLLENVVGAEAKSQEVPSDSRGAPHQVVRIATGVALIALILIVILFGPKPLTPAALSAVDPQAVAINNQIESLAPGAPVLVAVDYGGGLAGELNIVAQPVLQHLMAKNARIVFVSTQIEGPALAESLFSTARLNGGSVYPQALEANLGYLVGGSTALKSLAASPLSTSLPVPWGGNGTWNQSALSGLSQITDFAQVILLTDTPENARDWVEQAQPELAAKHVPLIVLSSAQAAPMLRPYQQSGQITALLSGLTGGAAYEQLRQVRGAGTTSYNAYLAGILAMTLFILMGGIVSLGSRILTSKPKRKA